MLVRKKPGIVSRSKPLGLVGAGHMPAADHQRGQHAERRGLTASVRFFVDYSISVAVNSVARRQAQRAILSISCLDGLQMKVFISMKNEPSGPKFVAYSGDMSCFLNPSAGLFVVNETPRELEHSIYLFLSEQLRGHDSVRAEVHRETHSVYGLPVLEGCSDDGPRSLHVRLNPPAR
jgi:hypothetical protein